MNGNQLNEKIVEVSKTIFSYCMAKTPNREEAEDLSQDIIYELIKSSKNLRDDNAFYGFMWAVADNVYKQWCRKKVKNNICKLPDDIPSKENLFEFDDDNNDIFLLRRELSLLSEKYRHATILYYIDKKSCSEISQSLSISESMVKYLLFKSRKILKEGMNMERKLGTLSYNPKALIPMYSGEGPNYFWDFMQSKIRQNIIGACYNDSLTPQQISLETGIPLPYLDDEIEALTSKNLLVKDGNHYKTNIIVITSDCNSELDRNATMYHEEIANTINDFISANLSELKAIGFIGSDFSTNSMRWILATLIFRATMNYNTVDKALEMPTTAWSEKAYLFCTEKTPETSEQIFAYSGMNSKNKDTLLFLDYRPKLRGDHHDFYGNDRYVNIICDIAKGEWKNFSEYDLEAIAEMIRLGYVIKINDTYKLTLPIFTNAQYEKAYALAKKFVDEELSNILSALNSSAMKILSNHTPKHLQEQVPGIAALDKFIHAISIPATIMIEKNYLSTDWKALEMPTNFIILNR